ncbi:family S53 protease-like protein [Trametes meyenii]|nr:family S53 protease-like protein [Trametes meyenii]
MLAYALLLFGLVVMSCGKPFARNLQVHETISKIPFTFRLVGSAPPDAPLTLRIGIAQGNVSGLEKALLAVSTPGNALYRQHLTREEVNAFMAPKAESASAVKAWLKDNDIKTTKVSSAGDWLTISIPVSKASELLDAEFSVFNHTPTGRTSIRTLSYSIPADLRGHLEFVHPTTAFTQPFIGPAFTAHPSRGNITVPRGATTNLSSDATVPSSCKNTITPQCLQALYGIPTTRASVSTNTLAVSGFIDEFANQADLRKFLTAFRPDLPSTTTFTLQTIDGGENPQQVNQAGIEADLDTQYTIGIASAVPTTFISVGDDNSDQLGGFLDLIDSLVGQASPPHVLTTSYSFNEDDISIILAANLCTAYAQLGARGTSIFFSSGDGGVSGSQSQECTSFVATIPSVCPFVTSVGATTGVNPEIAATFSSGGFSNFFAQPSYQTAAVEGFFNQIGNLNAGLFNPGGRGFPDIAAQGDNVEIVFAQQFGTVAGTSCSTPISASLFALLNDEFAAVGEPPLGFLNPLLYSLAGTTAFNDITSGSNPGCNTLGFPAVKGWDPITGLGTPNFAAIRSFTLGL